MVYQITISYVTDIGK